MRVVDDKKRMNDFGIKLIEFYKEFLLGTAKSVKILSEIQAEFGAEYETLSSVKDDPLAVNEVASKLEPKQREALFYVVLGASGLAVRLNKLFELSETEKRKLSTDITAFSKEVEAKLKKMIKDGK